MKFNLFTNDILRIILSIISHYNTSIIYYNLSLVSKRLSLFCKEKSKDNFCKKQLMKTGYNYILPNGNLHGDYVQSQQRGNVILLCRYVNGVRHGVTKQIFTYTVGYSEIISYYLNNRIIFELIICKGHYIKLYDMHANLILDINIP